MRRGPELRLSIGMLATISLVYGVLDVLMVVVAVELVGLGTGGVGVLNSAWGAGGTAGGIVALAILARGRFSTAMTAGAALVAVPLAVLAAAAHPLAAILGFGVLGLGYALIDTAGQTLVQRLASDESLARAFGVAETAMALAVTAGSVLAPLLIALLGVRGALVATALVAPAVVLARRRALLALDASAVVPVRELEALRAVDVFAPLPLAVVETLALRAVPRVVFADEQVLLRGDVGTRFSVIAQGTFEVQAGPVVRKLGPGDYFGEIALLRDVPRTAAVVAETDGLLYVLARDDFLSAVTGHARSTQTAESVADARLRASEYLARWRGPRRVQCPLRRRLRHRDGPLRRGLRHPLRPLPRGLGQDLLKLRLEVGHRHRRDRIRRRGRRRDRPAAPPRRHAAGLQEDAHHAARGRRVRACSALGQRRAPRAARRALPPAPPAARSPPPVRRPAASRSPRVRLESRDDVRVAWRARDRSAVPCSPGRTRLPGAQWPRAVATRCGAPQASGPRVPA